MTDDAGTGADGDAGNGASDTSGADGASDAADDRGADAPDPSREVTHTATGPVRLDEDDVDPEYGDVAVCMCGLSDDRPFCDGSHRATEGEERDGRYKYVDGERREIERIEYRDGDERDNENGNGTRSE